MNLRRDGGCAILDLLREVVGQAGMAAESVDRSTRATDRHDFRPHGSRQLMMHVGQTVTQAGCGRLVLTVATIGLVADPAAGETKRPRVGQEGQAR